MGKRDVKEIKVNVEVSGEEIHPTQVVLQLSVNALPSATIVYVPETYTKAEEGIIPMDSEKVFRYMGQQETKIFSVVESDTIIKVTDAFDNSIEYKGNATAPNYQLAAGRLSFTQHVEHHTSALNVFNMSCYSPKCSNIDYEEYSSKKVPEIILDIMDELINYCGARPEIGSAPGYASTLAERAVRVQHKLNLQERVITPAKGVFQRSLEEDMDGGIHFAWEELPEWLTIIDKLQSLRDRIIDLLRLNTGGFFGNILHFAQEFQELYIPNFEKIGYLKARRRIFEHSEPIELDIIDCSMSLGTMGWYPERAVGVELPEKLTSDTNIDFGNFRPDYITYPPLEPEKDPEEAVSIIPCTSPTWMPRKWFDCQSEAETEDTTVSGRSIYTPSQVESIQDEGVKDKEQEQERKKVEVITEWAKNEYIWQLLQSATCSITTELRLDLEVGVHYKVKNRDGKLLFSGLLYSITHTIKRGERDASATTQLMFSHVAYLSAKIRAVI